MKKGRRRELLLAHARDVFAQKGYHAAKIDDIVAQASVARGTFYFHFEDKRGIFEELVDDFLSRISLAIVRIRVDDAGSPPLAQLRDNVFRVLEVGLGDPGMTKILLKNAAGLDPDFDRKVRAFYRAIEELLALSLLNGQRMGLVRAGDRGVLGALALGSIKEILLQSVEERITSSALELADAVMRFLAGGILTPGLAGEIAATRKDWDELPSGDAAHS